LPVENNMLDDLLKEDNKVDWELFISRHQEYSPGFAYLILASMIPKSWFQKTTGLNYDPKYFKRVGDEYFWSSTQVQKLKQLWDKEGNQDSQIYLKHIKKIETYCNNLIKYSLKLKNTNLKKKTNYELIKYYSSYWEKLRKAASFMIPKHALNRVLETRIKAYLMQIPETQKAPEEIFDMLLSPTKETLISIANKQLAAMTSDEKLSDAKIKEWLQHYDWIETFTWLGKPLTLTDIKSKLSKIE
jgi:hypothetical protein